MIGFCSPVSCFAGRVGWIRDAASWPARARSATIRSNTGTGGAGSGTVVGPARAGRQVARRGARVVRGAEPGPLAAATPQQRRVPQHGQRSVRERAGGGRARSRGDERLPVRARVARLSQQRRLPHRAVARRAEVPRRRRADRRSGGRRQQLRHLRERHAGRRLRDDASSIRSASRSTAGRSPPTTRPATRPSTTRRSPAATTSRRASSGSSSRCCNRRSSSTGSSSARRRRAATRSRRSTRSRRASRTSTCRACRTRRCSRPPTRARWRRRRRSRRKRAACWPIPRATRLLDYFEQWLDTDTLPDMVRDATVYPNLDPTLPALLQGETRAFVADLRHVVDGHLRRALHRAVHLRERGARQALRPHRPDRVDVRAGRRPGARGRADAGDDARARQGDADLDRAARPQDPDGRAVPDRSGAAAQRRPLHPRQDRHRRLAARAARATPHGGGVRRAATT